MYLPALRIVLFHVLRSCREVQSAKMTAQEFLAAYNSIRHKLTNAELKKLNKPEALDLLKSTSDVLQKAEEIIYSQSDALLKSSNELVKQCEANRNASESALRSRNSASPGSNVSESYASKVSQPKMRPVYTTIVSSGDDAEQMNSDEMKNLMETCLQDVKVNYARVSSQGKLVVNVPDEKTFQIANQKLRESFPNSFSIDAPRKTLPKIMIFNIPITMSDSLFVSKVCEKDPKLHELMLGNETLEVVKSLSPKNESDSNVKNVVIKCSPKICEHIVNANNGQVYVGLTRYRAVDHLYIMQCYHCQGYNHMAKNCPDKSKDGICSKCAGVHDIKMCRSGISTCVYCIRSKTKGDKDHRATSPNCPCLLREKTFLRDRTDYVTTKN